MDQGGEMDLREKEGEKKVGCCAAAMADAQREVCWRREDAAVQKW